MTLVTEREDFIHPVLHDATVTVVQKPPSIGERLWNSTLLRKTVLVLFLAIIWEGYARWLDNELLFPTLMATLQALARAIQSGELTSRIVASLSVLLVGYGLGIVLAFLLAVAAITTRLGSDLLDILTSMLNPLPAVAL